MSGLSAEERVALHDAAPCDPDLIDGWEWGVLDRAVERIIAARLAAVEAVADEWTDTRHNLSLGVESRDRRLPVQSARLTSAPPSTPTEPTDERRPVTVTTLSEAVAATLTGERSAARLTHQQLADRADISERSLYRYLMGQREMTVATLDRICASLGLSVVDVITAAELRLDRERNRP